MNISISQQQEIVKITILPQILAHQHAYAFTYMKLY